MEDFECKQQIKIANSLILADRRRYINTKKAMKR